MGRPAPRTGPDAARVRPPGRPTLAATPEHAAAAAIPEAIVQAFYRVRFGDWMLDPQQDAEITAQLDQPGTTPVASLHHPSAVTGNGSPAGLSV